MENSIKKYIMKKRTILFLAIILIGTYSAYTQKEDQQKIGGIRGGYHLATMVEDGSKPDTAKNLSSFYVGFFKDQKIAKILFVGSGIEYFQNGLKYSKSSKLIMHTISVPVNLKVKIGPVYGRGGITANFIVKEKIEYDDKKYDPEKSDKANWFDSAAFAGVGVDILFLSVEARYYWGLIDAKNGLYNRYFQLGATVSF
jgi:hypothetical protein